MNASNNFTVVGFICKDAEVRNFEKSSIARFGVSIKTTEKKGGVEITKASEAAFLKVSNFCVLADKTYYCEIVTCVHNLYF